MKNTLREAEKLRHDCARWLRDHVSDIDWGYSMPPNFKDILRNTERDISGSLKLRCTNHDRKKKGLPPVSEVYINPHEDPRPFKKWVSLSLAKIHAHLAEEMTIFYGSRRSSGQALLMLDFDWHSEQIEAYGLASDAVRAAEYVRDVLFSEEEMYIERSTGGLGAHAYLLLECQFTSSTVLNQLLTTIASIISELIQREGFKSPFCGFYGNFTIVEDRWRIPRGGMSRQAKLPRPQTEAAMKRLMGLTPVSSRCFSAILQPVYVRICLEDNGIEADWVDGGMGMESGTACPLGASEGDCPSTSLDNANHGIHPHPGDHEQQGIYCGHNGRHGASDGREVESIRLMKNPNQRMFAATFLLARKISAPPSVEEAIKFYEQSGLSTGQDEGGRRRARAEDAVEACTRTFKKRESKGVARFLSLVEALISESDLAASGYFRQLHHQDVAIALHVLTGRLARTQSNWVFQATVAQRYMVKAFQKLQELGLSVRGLNGCKWAGIKKVLIKAGLIEKISSYGPGRAEQFRLGPRHPDRAKEAS